MSLETMSAIEKATLLRCSSENILRHTLDFHRGNLHKAIEEATGPGDGWPDSMSQDWREVLGYKGWTPKLEAYRTIQMKVHQVMYASRMLEFFRTGGVTP